MSILKPLNTRTKNLFSERLKEKIAFLHIPKCGGNSITSAIYDRYKTLDPKNQFRSAFIDANASLKTVEIFDGTDPFSDDFHNVLKFREYLLVYFMSQNASPFIHGHFSFSNLAYENYGHEYAFVTVLRDPVERWISSYFYNKYRHKNDLNIQEELSIYLESPRARSNGYEYVKKLTGRIDRGRDYTNADAIAEAKKNLDKFAVVGRLEDLDEFKVKFHARFGVKLQIGLQNQGPKPESFKKAVISQGIEMKIRDICQPDLEIYQHACKSR